MLRNVKASCFSDWRDQARELLRERVEPQVVIWNGIGEGAPLLELDWDEGPHLEARGSVAKVPSDFVRRAEVVACHNSSDTWDLLYRILWRIAVKGERSLLSRANDSDVARFALKEKQVRWERHKMTAYVRFRKVERVLNVDGRETFVAWYEPVHDVVRLAATFFRDRFRSFNWSILTPRTCVHWNGEKLKFSEGARKEDIPQEDELELYWKKYYGSIFNPARLNMKLMEREMPRRYWGNLPEAEIIAELAGESYGRVDAMKEHVDAEKASRKTPMGAPDGRERASCQSPDEIRSSTEGKSLPTLAELATRCQACDLCWNATQTVVGEGPDHARVVLVGEQPGDREDIVGRPFVGPAGQLLEDAFRQLELNRSEFYLTNVVKHFKWKGSGKRRLHQTPNAREVASCKPWLDAELRIVQPKLVVCLGETARRAILGNSAERRHERGLVDDPALPFLVIATYHPSFLLRIEDRAQKKRVWSEFCEDLKLVKAFLSNTC